MTELFGLTELPVQQPGSEESVVSDLLLERLGDFLKAVLNRMGQTAWQSRSPATMVVEHVFYHNPAEHFEENRLPAIYLWRSDSAEEKVADDVIKDTSTIQIYWLMEPAQEDHMVGRVPFRNAVNKMLIAALKRQRDPAWRVTGDTDSLAPTQGSFLPTWLGFNSMTRGASKTLELNLGERDGDGNPTVYRGIATNVVVEELITWDTTSFTEPAALDATINVNPSEGDDGPELGWIYEPPD